MPNPIDPITLTTLLLRLYFPLSHDPTIPERLTNLLLADTRISDDDYAELGLNLSHPNMLMFTGDMTSPSNFAFIENMMRQLDKCGVGMFVGTETFGSADKTLIPSLIATRILDEVQIKLPITSSWSRDAHSLGERALNSFTQCIAGRIHFSQDATSDTEEDIDAMPDLKNVILTLYYNAQSSLEVCKTYIDAVYAAITADKDIKLFDLFDICILYSEDVASGILQQITDYLIANFHAHRIYAMPWNSSSSFVCPYQ